MCQAGDCSVNGRARFRERPKACPRCNGEQVVWDAGADVVDCPECGPKGDIWNPDDWEGTQRPQNGADSPQDATPAPARGPRGAEEGRNAVSEPEPLSAAELDTIEAVAHEQSPHHPVPHLNGHATWRLIHGSRALLAERDALAAGSAAWERLLDLLAAHGWEFPRGASLAVEPALRYVEAAVTCAKATAASTRYFQDVPKADRDEATFNELFRAENAALFAYMAEEAADRAARDAEKGGEQ